MDWITFQKWSLWRGGGVCKVTVLKGSWNCTGAFDSNVCGSWQAVTDFHCTLANWYLYITCLISWIARSLSILLSCLRSAPGEFKKQSIGSFAAGTVPIMLLRINRSLKFFISSIFIFSRSSLTSYFLLFGLIISFTRSLLGEKTI